MEKKALLMAFVLAFELVFTGMGVYADDIQAEEESELIEAVDMLFEEADELSGNDVVDITENLTSDYSRFKDFEYAENMNEVIDSYVQEKSDYILGKSKCDYHEEINKEWKHQRNLTYYMIPQKTYLTCFVSRIYITDYTVSGDFLFANLYEWNAGSYKYADNDEENSFGYGYNYFLAISGNTILAVSENKADDGGGYHELEQSENTREEADQSVNFMVRSVPDGNAEIFDVEEFTYDPEKASDYAQKYAYEYNSDYVHFSGNDCANFVSQSLYAGGLAMTSEWNYRSASSYTSAWVNATGLYNYLSDNVGKLVDYPENSDISVGDACFYWNGSRWGHSAICTKVDSHGNPLVCAHSNDRLNVNWKMASHCAVVQIPSSGEAGRNSGELISENQPAQRVNVIRGDDIEIAYNSEIAFPGKKLKLDNFGEFSVSYNGEEYSVSKVKINRKHQLIQITDLDGAPEDVVRLVRKATKGDLRLGYSIKKYTVSDNDAIKTKFTKKGKLKWVKILLGDSWYKVKRSWYSYDEDSAQIIFDSDDLYGIYKL